MLRLTNTLTKKKEVFQPIDPSMVRLYVCGITPYDYAHIGHGRVYVTFDILYRLLSFLGFKTDYCRNFTDIDDKLIHRAHQELGDGLLYATIAQRYIDSFQEDVAQLNCLIPTHQPRVTQTIPEIIHFIQGLIDHNKAYVVDGDVYYSIDNFSPYGALSGQSLADLQAGARVEPNSKKRNPLDFALWKAEKEATFFQSPWGWGRPGWHIECSAMAYKFLGEQIDIHGGGMDLMFPHHENEIAQTEGLFDKQFSRFWVHNAFVRINKEKMSKSLNNFFTLRDVFKDFDPMVVRYLMINHQYRNPLDFAYDDLVSLQKGYQRLCAIFKDTAISSLTIQDVKKSLLAQKMLDFLCDDLNTPGLLGVVFENAKLLEANEQERAAVLYILKNILGLTLQPLEEKKVAITPEIQQLLDERVQARAQKEWKKADELRDRLKELGVEIQDKKI